MITPASQGNAFLQAMIRTKSTQKVGKNEVFLQGLFVKSRKQIRFCVVLCWTGGETLFCTCCSTCFSKLLAG